MERWQVEEEVDSIKNTWLKNEKTMERWQVEEEIDLIKNT